MKSQGWQDIKYKSEIIMSIVRKRFSYILVKGLFKLLWHHLNRVKKFKEIFGKFLVFFHSINRHSKSAIFVIEPFYEAFLQILIIFELAPYPIKNVYASFNNLFLPWVQTSWNGSNSHNKATNFLECLHFRLNETQKMKDVFLYCTVPSNYRVIIPLNSLNYRVNQELVVIS